MIEVEIKGDARFDIGCTHEDNVFTHCVLPERAAKGKNTHILRNRTIWDDTFYGAP